MKTLAIIVTYYPNIEEVTKNILQFLDNVDTLIVWQNTPLIDNENYFVNPNLFGEKVIFMGNGKNMGIAYALNQAYELMMNEGKNFTHLLTMDQDSNWVNFEEYLKVISLQSNNLIFTPNINDEIQGGEELIKVKTCITSGAVFPIEALRIIGKFNEIYSVDCVDYDFSFKATKNNINIFKVQAAHLNQIYGQPTKSKYFNLENNIYSSKRLFFIARNHILLWRDYPSHIDFQFKRMILSSHIFGKIIKVVFMEENKLKKIFSILNGFYAGLINNRRDTY